MVLRDQRKESVAALVPDSNLLLLVLYRAPPFPSTESRFLLVRYEYGFIYYFDPFYNKSF